MTRNNKALLAAVIVVVSAIAYFKTRETAVTGSIEEKLARMIQLSVDATNAKNRQAFGLCESEINAILSQQFPEVTRQGLLAGKDIASYGSCCKIIYSLARDKITSSNTAAEYVDAQMHAYMEQPLKKLTGDLETAIGRFDLSLKENTVGLARELAQMNPRNAGKAIVLPTDVKSSDDINKALNNLGLGGITIGISTPLDIWAVMNAKIVKSITAKVTASATLMFARPAAAAVSEVAIAAADGPLPIGDIIAVIGGLWTAYDIYSTQKQFEVEMRTSVENMMPDLQRSIQKQVIGHIHSISKEHQRLQDEIRQHSIREYAK